MKPVVAPVVAADFADELEPVFSNGKRSSPARGPVVASFAVGAEILIAQGEVHLCTLRGGWPGEREQRNETGEQGNGSGSGQAGVLDHWDLFRVMRDLAINRLSPSAEATSYHRQSHEHAQNPSRPGTTHAPAAGRVGRNRR